MAYETEMMRTYGTWFKIGFGSVVAAFIVLNIYSSVSERAAYLNQPIKFDHGGYSWGFPLKMYQNYLGFPSNSIGFDAVPTAINIILAFAFAGLVGIAFEAVAGRLRNK